MKQEQLQLTGGGDQSKRRELDYYPTPKECTHALMLFLHKNCDWFFSDPLRIWEPACGNGAMSEVLRKYGHRIISTELSIDGTYGETGIDFLKCTPYECDAIITNPPFNLSEEFIVKYLGNTKIVCMLLKSQYWHAKSRLTLFNQHTPQYVLPLTWRPDFLEHTRKAGDKIGPTMEVAWSVWIKGTHKETRYIPLEKPNLKPALF